MDVDWNEAGKSAVVAILGEVPTVGAVLGAVVDQLWPATEEDVWGEISERVQELIDQSLSAAYTAEISDKLSGLKDAVEHDRETVRHGTPQQAATEWTALQVVFTSELPAFKHNGVDGDYRVLLLPSFAQVATLYLGVLRDAVVAGALWWQPQDLAQRRLDLTKAVAACADYAMRTYQLGLVPKQQTPQDNHACEPFRTVNAYVRYMTLNVLDYRALWPYLDPTAQPGPPPPSVLGREIYSDPFGTADDSGPIPLPYASRPTGAIDRIKVYAGSMIEAIEVLYYDGGGPDGLTTTGPMGQRAATGRSVGPPNGGTAWVGPSRVACVDVVPGNVFEGLTLHMEDGRVQGFRAAGGTRVQYAGHIVSSLYVNGPSDFYGSADALVIGFTRQEAAASPPPSTTAQ